MCKLRRHSPSLGAIGRSLSRRGILRSRTKLITGPQRLVEAAPASGRSILADERWLAMCERALGVTSIERDRPDDPPDPTARRRVVRFDDGELTLVQIIRAAL